MRVSHNGKAVWRLWTRCSRPPTPHEPEPTRAGVPDLRTLSHRARAGAVRDCQIYRLSLAMRREDGSSGFVRPLLERSLGAQSVPRAFGRRVCQPFLAAGDGAKEIGADAGA